MSPRTEYLQWRYRPQVGCMFARAIAGNPDRYDQRIDVVPSRGTPARVAGTIDRRIERLIADKNVAAAGLLFPDLVLLERTAQVFLALGDRNGWSVNTTQIENLEIGTMTAVNIVRDIPFGRGSCPSEALVFGPFEEFALTRRAPITAFEMFVGEPMESDPKFGRPTTKANLAHMDMHLPTRRTFDAMWEKSIQGRLTSLGGVNDNRAKARVTFVIPAALAHRLGV